MGYDAVPNGSVKPDLIGTAERFTTVGVLVGSQETKSKRRHPTGVCESEAAALPEVQIIGGIETVVRSEALRSLMLTAQKIAHHDNSVLITGETGTGKEIIARTIHHYSLRCHRAFIDVNCAALPEHLVESELFGYEKGAFSGAEATKPGLFELAHQGTLFLDEIGELDAKIQVKLLRVLDGIPYYRLGGHRKVTVDVRVVAATNQDIQAAIHAGKFRRDLYHRLSQFELCVPPLRERTADVIGIAEHLLKRHSPCLRFTTEALDALRHYPWPGNVRELKNSVLTAAMTVPEGTCDIQASHLALEMSTAASTDVIEATGTDLGQMEKQVILRTLAQTGGRRGQAAEQLGVSRRTLLRKIKAYNVGEPMADAENRRSAPNSQPSRYFRVTIELPVSVRVAGQEIDARSINISSRGIALRLPEPLKHPRGLSVILHLPDKKDPIQATADLAWSDSDGTAGLEFTELIPAAKRLLESWVSQHLKEEKNPASTARAFAGQR